MRLKKRRAVLRLGAAAAVILAASLGAAVWRWAHAPRVWKPEEVPVAFWSWRAETPRQEDIERASKEAGASALFLRAGQFDFASGRVSRVRAVEGRMPAGCELHLAYNATPALLAQFERIDENTLAEAFAGTFRADSERAARDGVRVAGLQLDLDVPTRLLLKYARVLRATRGLLRSNATTGAQSLSVTGLQTWMGARELRDVLDAVDFWVPQFYGAEIPATVDKLIPISSPKSVAASVARARALGKPYFAGLAAYGYALLYSEKGKLIDARGDIDPARVASDRNLELVERRAFGSRVEGDGAGADAPLAGEWRYVFRARDDEVVEGLVVRAGEQIVLDVPSSESLRASARGVREAAGDKLLGICIFRLPAREDPSTLTLPQVVAALRDREAETSTRVSIEPARVEDTNEKSFNQITFNEKISNRLTITAESSNQLIVTAENTGQAGTLYGDGAFAVTLRVPAGSVRGVTRLEGFDTFETLCEPAEILAKRTNARAFEASSGEGSSARAGLMQGVSSSLRPCSAARANVVRVSARAWPPGARASAGLSFDGDVRGSLSSEVAVLRDDGRVLRWQEGQGTKGTEGR